MNNSSSFPTKAAAAWRRAILAALLVGITDGPSLIPDARALVIEAESLVKEPDASGDCVWAERGYVFEKAANAVGGWVDVQAKEQIDRTFKPRTDPVLLTVPPNLLAVDGILCCVNLLKEGLPGGVSRPDPDVVFTLPPFRMYAGVVF